MERYPRIGETDRICRTMAQARLESNVSKVFQVSSVSCLQPLREEPLPSRRGRLSEVEHFQIREGSC